LTRNILCDIAGQNSDTQVEARII